MIIKNLTNRKNGNLSGIAATIIWEDRDRPEQEIYIDTTAEFASDLSCNPHSFLVACIMVAFHYGEKRIAIDAEICPELRQGLITAMGWVRHWYKCDRPLVQIEAKIQSQPTTHLSNRRAGLFFSGGIDALSTLRNNHLNFPPQHPRTIKDALMVYGLANTTLETFEQAITSLQNVTQDAGVTLIPVYTNIYSHVKDLEYSDYKFWRYYLGGAALAAIGHAFHKRLNFTYISSSDQIAYLGPWGTHPLLDTNYSSYDLRIHYADINLSRLDKTKLIAEWNIALQHLRVCDELVLPAGYLNCGQCPKCVMTMSALAALGVLDKTNTFPVNNINAKLLLAQGRPFDPDEEANYLELLPLLKNKQRSDLIRAIKLISWRYRVKNSLKQLKQTLTVR